MNRPCLADQHAAVWAAIDALAGQRCVTLRGLALQAGLDRTSLRTATRFRQRPGKAPGSTVLALRWPSTETIARLLRATNRGWDDWGRLVEAALPQPGIRKEAA